MTKRWMTLVLLTTCLEWTTPCIWHFWATSMGKRRISFRELLQRAGVGLQRIFSYCEDFTPDCDLLPWMKAHDRRAHTIYWNWLGRTVRQIREEDSLFIALQTFLGNNNLSLTKMTPREVHASLVKFARGEQEAGRLVLTPPAPTPLAWQLRNLWDLIWVPLVLLVLSPVLLAYAPFFIFQLRSREKSDLVLTPRPDPDHVRRLVEIEDHGVTNQFTAFGSIKPGIFRRWSFRYYLWIIDYTTRHFYNRARPVYVNTIHFARVVLFDDGRRLFFASSYDGSLDSYLDDFINKISFGLNILFTQGIGYPRTRWIFLGGAKQEQEFKYYVRRHEMVTEVWYNAHPGLTCVDLQRNSLIRAGLENNTMTEAEITKWLQLF